MSNVGSTISIQGSSGLAGQNRQTGSSALQKERIRAYTEDGTYSVSARAGGVEDSSRVRSDSERRQEYDSLFASVNGWGNGQQGANNSSSANKGS